MTNQRRFPSSSSATTQDGTVVRKGDWVGFKSDIEQWGQIDRIERRGFQNVLVLTNEHGFDGDYIGGRKQTSVDANDCWAD